MNSTKRQAVIGQNSAAEIAIQMVFDSLTSTHGKRAYKRHRLELSWHKASGQTVMSKALVQR